MDAHADSPARTTDIQIKVRAGHELYATKQEVQKVVDDVFIQHGIDPGYPVVVQTWEETNAKFLSAIEKEKVLVTLLFAMISIVAIFLIFCIFYMIVVEKTKDIGIIKSVGATGSGVAGIFLGYGFAIGVVGGGLGLLFSYLIVHNINELHEWMGRALHVQMWDPEVYAFDTIPNTMNLREIIVIVGVAVIASVLGALVPAIRAARMHPVEALRWE
jgi:lipoprotein-releasing system permease protein